jgi:glycosyltransferase involved in cell wall biosynthesis
MLRAGSTPANRLVTVLIHFPQRSTGSSSMSCYCDLLVNGLSKLGYEVHVVSKQGLVEAAQQWPWRMLLTKTPAVLSTWPALIRQHLKYPKNCVVNISQEYIPPFAASKSINIIHDLIQIDYPRSRLVGFFYRYLLPKLARNAALNISVSNSTAAGLAAMRVPSRVVYNEFKLPDRSQNAILESGARRYTACWVGTLSKHKNIGDYLAAGEALPDKAFVAILPERDARRIRIEFDVPANMDIFHSLDAKDYGDLLRASKFLVSTSLAEGFGRPPADGALAGCDIVLTDIAIYRELYQGLAHFYAPGDTANLAATLTKTPIDIYADALARIKGWGEQHSLVDVIDEAINKLNL